MLCDFVAAIILKSKDIRGVQEVMEERESLNVQVKGLQELLRSNMAEVEMFRKMMADGSKASSAAAGGEDADKKQQQALQESIVALRTELADAQRSLSEAEAVAAEAAAAAAAEAAAASDPSGAPQDGGMAEAASAAAAAAAALAGRVEDIKTRLLAAEEEAEDSASAAVKQTRMRERKEREGRERLAALEAQLDAKVREAAALHEAASNADAAHARDLEVRAAAARGPQSTHTHMPLRPPFADGAHAREREGAGDHAHARREQRPGRRPGCNEVAGACALTRAPAHAP